MANPQVTVTANKFDPNTQTYSPATPTKTNTISSSANAGVPTAEQNLANYNASQVKIPSMNAGNIGATTPIPIVSPFVDPNSYTSKINSVASDLNTTLASSQANVDSLNQQGKNQALDISNLQSLMGGKSADIQKTYDEQGVTKSYNQLVDLNAQATGLKNEATAIPIQIQNEFKGTGATDAGVAPIQTSRLRDNALKALSLGQQAAIASAQYDKAKNYADLIVDSKYAQMEADIKAKQTNLAALNDYQLTPAQNKLKDDKQAALSAQAQQLADKKDLEKNINSVLLEAQKNGASPATIKAIQNSGSMGDAIKNAGTSLSSPETEVIKLGNDTAYLVDKRTGKVIRSFGGGGGSSGGGASGYSVTTNSNGSVNITGTTPATATYGNVLNTVLGSAKFTAAQKADLVNSIKSGNDPMTVLKNQAKMMLSGANQTKLENAETARDSFNDLAKSLQAFYDAGGKTSLVKGTLENVQNNFGKVNDPKLAGLAIQVKANLQVYRNAISGTAYSEQEGRDIASIFPNIDKTQGLNNAIIKARQTTFDSVIDSAYGNALGKENYNSLKTLEEAKTKPFAIGNMSPSDFVEKSLVRKGIVYTDLINKTPQGQIPIVDKNTGEAYYIPYKDFNAETDIKI